MPNRQLLLETLESIIENQRRWGQQDWISSEAFLDIGVEDIYTPIAEGTLCKTAYCFAGHAAVASGYPDFNDWLKTVWMPFHNVDMKHLTYRDLDRAQRQWIWKAIPGVSVSQYAREKLGLSSEQADALFSANNTLDDLREIIERILNDELVEEDLSQI